MRVEAEAASLSWIPSDSLAAVLKAGMDLRISHFDDPPPDRVGVPHEVRDLRDADRFRFANVIAASAEFDDAGRLVSASYDKHSGIVMGSTTVTLGRLGATFRAVLLPTIQRSPDGADGAVRFVQTVGGRTGLPLPRPVPHPPYVRWQAPTVWTTLTLTLHADGRSEVALTDASAFPRHWVYGVDGTVSLKSGLSDQARWMAHALARRTPWADQDREVVVAAESSFERELSTDIMRGGARPEIREIPSGAALTRQGEPGDELYLVLDGVVRVDVDGNVLAELGPGAVIGERALLGGGIRTSTVTALSPLRLAVASREALDLDKLRALADSHRREDHA